MTFNLKLVYDQKYMESANLDIAKRAAALQTLSFVRSGQLLGLGSGTTTAYFIDALAALVRDGLRIRAVSTSLETQKRAERGGIPIVDLADQPLDLYVDGADEVDREKRLIKGAGGALLREKIVAFHSLKRVIIVDRSKLSLELHRVPLPIEVVPFAYQATRRRVEELGVRVHVRMGGDNPFVTDNGNYLFDLVAPPSGWPIPLQKLEEALKLIPGVLESGLFLRLADLIVVGDVDGSGHIL